MQPEEKREMLELLAGGRQTVLHSVQGVNEEAAARHPAGGRWSILDCVEHLAVAEDHLFAQITAAQHAGVPTVNEKREAAIRSRGADRSRRVPAPEGAKPAGRFASLAGALEHFLRSRDRTSQFVENCSADLRSEMATHPIIGTVNCYEMLLMMAAHPYRHAEQIREIRAEVAKE